MAGPILTVVVKLLSPVAVMVSEWLPLLTPAKFTTPVAFVCPICPSRSTVAPDTRPEPSDTVTEIDPVPVGVTGLADGVGEALEGTAKSKAPAWPRSWRRKWSWRLVWV